MKHVATKRSISNLIISWLWNINCLNISLCLPTVSSIIKEWIFLLKDCCFFFSDWIIEILNVMQQRKLSHQRRTKCHNKDVLQEQFPTHESVYTCIICSKEHWNIKGEQRCLAGTVPHPWKCIVSSWKPATLLRSCTDYVTFWAVGDKWESQILCIKTLFILFHFLIWNQLDIQKAISSHLTRQGFD